MQVIFRGKPKPADRLAGGHPVKGNERIIARHACRIRASSDRNTHFKHPPQWRRSLCRFRSKTINKIFALVSHAMLNGDAASERFDALDIRIGNRFAMVEKPVKPLERYIAVYLFENT